MIIGEMKAGCILERKLYRTSQLLPSHIIFIGRIIGTGTRGTGMEHGPITGWTIHLR